MTSATAGSALSGADLRAGSDIQASTEHITNQAQHDGTSATTGQPPASGQGVSSPVHGQQQQISQQNLQQIFIKFVVKT